MKIRLWQNLHIVRNLTLVLTKPKIRAMITGVMEKEFYVQQINIVKLKSKGEPKNTWVRFSHGLFKDESLTANAKLVYAHMLDKYMFFSSQNKEYYENLVDIGKAVGGMSKNTVRDCVKKLEDKGWIDIRTKKIYATAKSITSNSYTVRDIFGVYVPTRPEKVVELEQDTPF